MDTPVTFEIAKLLKEKGFDNESSNYYTREGERRYDSDFPSLQPTKYFEYYDSPTIADVVMWLYEKHGIWISLTHQHNQFFWSFGSYQTQDFNSPTEAYEAAIEYTLNNLI